MLFRFFSFSRIVTTSILWQWNQSFNTQQYTEAIWVWRMYHTANFTFCLKISRVFFFLVQINNWKKSRPQNLCLNKYVMETMPNTIYKKKSKANTRADWFKTVFLFNSIDLFIRASLPPRGLQEIQKTQNQAQNITSLNLLP